MYASLQRGMNTQLRLLCCIKHRTHALIARTNIYQFYLFVIQLGELKFNYNLMSPDCYTVLRKHNRVHVEKNDVKNPLLINQLLFTRFQQILILKNNKRNRTHFLYAIKIVFVDSLEEQVGFVFGDKINNNYRCNLRMTKMIITTNNSRCRLALKQLRRQSSSLL